MSTFFAELKRRNVFKVGVAYAIVAWLLIQITATVLPTFDAPHWVLQTITYIILLGFPLALFFAWAFELTPEGIKPTKSAALVNNINQTKSQRLNYLILGLVVLAVVFMLVDNYVLTDGSPANLASVAGMATTGKTVAGGTESAGVMASPRASSSSARIRRYSINLGQTHPMIGSQVSAYIALSSDDSRLAYVLNNEGTPRLYYRALDQLTARVIPTTVAPYADIFFSPDGEWVGFAAQNSGLYKVSILGGPAQQLSGTMYAGGGGFWTEDDVIYFSIGQKLHRIAATGGTPEPVNITSELADWKQGWPYGLPGGGQLLFTVQKGLARDTAHIALLSLSTGEARILIHNAYNARYVPTGHIVFMRSESLWAVPFDVTRLETTGPEVPVVNGIQTEGQRGHAIYAFSDAGLLVYLPGGDTQISSVGIRNLVWVDREGKETPLDVEAKAYSAPRLSPDGKQLAVVVSNPDGQDAWTYDFSRGIFSRRTFTGNGSRAFWTPDGERLVYTFYPDFHGLSWVKADGTGQAEYLIDTPRNLVPNSFSRDGAQMVYQESAEGSDIYIMSMTGERTERPLIASKFNEGQASISPDGRWIAYVSNETGLNEIYVRPFPDVEGGKWQISNDGGREPLWRGDGKELFYLSANDREIEIAAVTIESEPRFIASAPVILFQKDYPRLFYPQYDVTADGQRFIMMKPAEQATTDDIESQLTSLVVVENWFEELKRLAPPAQ